MREGFITEITMGDPFENGAGKCSAAELSGDVPRCEAQTGTFVVSVIVQTPRTIRD